MIMWPAYIISAILAGGVLVSIIGQSVWLKKLIRGEVTPEEFESGRPEWGNTEVVGFRSRIGGRLVAAGKKILGEELNGDSDSEG